MAKAKENGKKIEKITSCKPRVRIQCKDEYINNQGTEMTKTQAHQLLDSLKQGHNASILDVTRALWITGDVTEEPLGLYERSKTAPKSFAEEFKQLVTQ